VGWKAAGFKYTPAWSAVVATAPSAGQLSNLHSKMEPPMQVSTV
jgi:hypothetical protein